MKLKVTIMDNWEEDLQKVIGQQPIIIIKKQKRSGGLGFIAFILVLAIAFVYAYKKVPGFNQWVSGHFHFEKIQKPRNEMLESKPKDDGLTERIKNIEDELKKNSRKIGVLGIINNENFSILGDETNKDFIMLNHDWKMSRIPKKLKIEGDDKEFIEQNSKQ